MTQSEDLWKVSVLFLCLLFPSVNCQENGLSYFPKIRNSSVKDTTGGTNGLDIQTNCTINISDESKYLFTSMILQGKYNFVHLKLEFDNFIITESDEAVEYQKWVWTYKGLKGGYQNLLLPIGYGYLSFYLLWAHTSVRSKQVHLYSSGTCTNLTSGNETDAMISNALGEMTNEIAAQESVYNSSYWCYNFHKEEKGIVKFLCEYFACPHQAVEYRCCKYMISFATKARSIVCNLENYQPGSVWWGFAIVLGCICWVYHPLLITFICYKLTNASLEMNNVTNNQSDDFTEQFVFLRKNRYPITFLGILKQTLCICNVKDKLCSRFIRFMFIFSPLALLALKVLLALQYDGDFIEDAVSKGSYVSFNNLLVDFQTAKRKYLIVFGGPHIALAIFVLLSCIFIQIPQEIETFLARGLCKTVGLSPLTLPVKSKCHLAGLRYKTMTRFKKLHYSLSSNLLLLLMKAFWKHTFQMFRFRWNTIVDPYLQQICPSCPSNIKRTPWIIGYIVFCLFEITVMLLLYLLPIASFPLIFCKAYINSIITLCNKRSNRFTKTLCYILIPFTFIALSYIWYIHCLVSFHCIWFVLAMILDTYSGMIAYPRISYGYLILVFMTIYYVVEICNNFGKSYQKLLRVTMKAIKNVKFSSSGKTIEIRNDKGIPKKIWELVIEKHQPISLKVASTILHVAFLSLVLYASVNLLETFNQFQELSEIKDVFTALAVCALPQIIRSFYIDSLCGDNKYKLQREIERTLLDYSEDTIENNVLIYHQNYHRMYT